MEQRLIDANALEILFKGWISQIKVEGTDFYNGCIDGIESCLDVLVKQPTVDAVEVVRCKECIHWYDQEEVCLKIYDDGAASPYAWQFRKPEDFCSYGERRDSDG